MNELVRGVIDDISVYSIVLPLIFGFSFLKCLSRDSLIVLGIVTLGSYPELLGKFTTDTLIRHVAYNLYTPFEFSMLFLLYNGKFHNRLNRQLFLISVRVYLVLSLAIVGYFGIGQRFLNEWVCVNNILFTAWTLMVFTEEFQSEEGSGLSFEVPFFWYMTAYFFYSPCTLLVYSLWQYSQDPVVKIIHNVFNTCMYAFFTIGFIKDVERI